MLSYRHTSGALWTLFGFMITAAVVLNLRYRPLDEGSVLLDTWTGDLRAVATAPAVETVETLAEASSAGALEIAVLRGLIQRRDAPAATCGSVRFAFPAPERVEVEARQVRPGLDYR